MFSNFCEYNLESYFSNLIAEFNFLDDHILMKWGTENLKKIYLHITFLNIIKIIN